MRDKLFMDMALRLARRHMGRTGSNPSVGCVIVKDGVVVGRGVTGVGGAPHAEVIACKQAGEFAKGATVYVSLEPCSHVGKTGPCVDVLINAGVARVVVAVIDPFHEVAGKGVERLKEAGIEADVGVGAEEAREVNQGFFMVQEEGRPFVTLKIATSLDGKIAAGEWVTDVEARRRSHLFRANHDAILIGSGTCKVDDPELTCRISGLEDASPTRVVLDGEGAIGLDSKLVKSVGHVPLWLVVDKARANAVYIAKLEAKGVEIFEGDALDGKFVIADLLKTLAQHGVTRLLVEGGPAVWTSFLDAGLVDELVWFRGDQVLEGEELFDFGAFFERSSFNLRLIKGKENDMFTRYVFHL